MSHSAPAPWPSMPDIKAGYQARTPCRKFTLRWRVCFRSSSPGLSWKESLWSIDENHHFPLHPKKEWQSPASLPGTYSRSSCQLANSSFFSVTQMPLASLPTVIPECCCFRNWATAVPEPPLTLAKVRKPWRMGL